MSTHATAALPPGANGAGAILLGSGNYFNLLDPIRSQFTMEDIAYGLAYTGRFAGQCFMPRFNRRAFYSVAEHCVRMSRIVPPMLARAALLHDAAEAFMGDMSSPLKAHCADFKAIERNVEAALFTPLGITRDELRAVKHFDLVMLATERRDLMRWGGDRWAILDGIEPHPEIIYPMDPEAAALAFLRRHAEIEADQFASIA